MGQVIRCDQWKLKPAGAQQPHLHATVALFRAYVDLLEGVVYTHWPELMRAPSICHAVEKLIHATQKNPYPRYPQFDRRFGKFPSYLRRAAIEFVVGQVSSFISNYDRWQAGIRSKKDAKPPRRGCHPDANPALYRGQMIKFHDGYKTVEIKAWNRHDWVWEKMPIVGHRQRHTVSTNKQLCPSLILNGARAKLAVPFQIKRIKFVHQEAVCAADLGINTTAVASIVQVDGTVVARRFIHSAADIDRRDKSLAQIRHKAHLTGQLSEGFCKGLYAKGRHRNLQIACDVARELMAFARAHQVTVIVFEHLKKFRPKGGRRRSSLRQRFHGWLHRLIDKRVQLKAQELGWKVAFVNHRGTSKYAFDGGGEVKRDDNNRAWATFKSGKRYNCDLSASYNIAARYLVAQFVKRAGVSQWRQLLPKGHALYCAASAADRPGTNPAAGVAGGGTKGHKSRPGRGRSSSKAARREPRIPVTLSVLWLIARAREEEAAVTAA